MQCKENENNTVETTTYCGNRANAKCNMAMLATKNESCNKSPVDKSNIAREIIVVIRNSRKETEKAKEN